MQQRIAMSDAARQKIRNMGLLCAMLVVSHNVGAISLVADRIGVMRKGRLVELGERDQVLHAPEHPYTKDLIAAVPRPHGGLPRIPERSGY